MKDQATVVFRRLTSGEVLGEIIDIKGVIVDSKSFGIMTEAEYRKILKLVESEHPDIPVIKPIEISGN